MEGDWNDVLAIEHDLGARRVRCRSGGLDALNQRAGVDVAEQHRLIRNDAGKAGHGEKRIGDTHASTRDPGSRLYRTSGAAVGVRPKSSVLQRVQLNAHESGIFARLTLLTTAEYAIAVVGKVNVQHPFRLPCTAHGNPSQALASPPPPAEEDLNLASSTPSAGVDGSSYARTDLIK